MPLLPAQTATQANHQRYAPRTVPGDSAPAWVTRGANFVVVVSRVSPGDTLVRDNPDEYVLVVPPDAPNLWVQVQAGAESVRAGADSLTIVPPGHSTLRIEGSGLVARIFSSDATDLLALADNRDTYAQPNPDVAPLAAWPEPVGGYRLRHYHLPDYVTEGSQMRVFSTRKLMVNPLLKRSVPRDVHKLTPHSHADFEQGSLALAGNYVHHLRYPWGTDMTLWQEDQAVQMGSPSLLVVPPKVIHTSRNIDAPGVLLDIFAPPRWDFSRKGQVCNAADYPMPPEA
jgi:mannose-6-phosphate isomerase-like protein (cupin superfamily)